MTMKVKELFQEHLAKLIAALLIYLSGRIFWEIIPLLLSPLWSRVSAPTLQRMLGLSFLSVLVLLTYIFVLLYQFKKKPRARFGLLWDKNANPLCPACQKHLGSYMERAASGWSIWCIQCNKALHIRDDEGKRVSLVEAKQAVLGKALQT
jgi:hypothetical protein